MTDMRTRLSTLWIFWILTALYCDVLSLMDPELLKQYLTGQVEGLDVTPGFLLGAAILIEIPIAMTLVSRLAKPRANRWLNIAAGAFMTLVQSATLLVGTPAMYYVFASVVEISCTSFIVWSACRWRLPQLDPATVHQRPPSTHAGGG